MKTLKLNNEVEIPVLGFGVFNISDEETKDAVASAIKAGYRHIDTAQLYLNERGVGEGIKASGIPRKELFITTKIWINNTNYENARSSFMRSLEKLQLDYVDLLLIHQPYNDTFGAWRAMIELKNEGKIRAIGVSNFGIDKLVDLSLFSEEKPVINQIELNPFCQQKEAVKQFKEEGVVVEAWSTFARGKDDIFNNKTLVDIAKKHNKTVAQIIIRYFIEQDIVVLTKSSHPKRMKENLNVFDFKLDSDDIQKISALDRKESQFFSHKDPKVIRSLAQRKAE
ncbi:MULTISPECIES: aldo/keto reductase [Gemella]|uniref:aldo/keto reductase n=1 Tax=Gemella TaxID=1378 RepID=UPI00076840A6|nr:MULTISPECIES: aldo/keto reductase [Gemella]AME08909.1 2,5-diketo-D-gluconic acid reductase [Gemella sp. oral taxon 928]AXI26481.1 aldo/keto reductase [Gemella sp. ND 6198]